MIKIEGLAPLLKQDGEVLDLAKQINELEELYNQKVIVIKTACPHPKLIKIYEHPHAVFDSDKGALLKTECSDCGLVRKKPDGMPWQICEKCWGKMADDGRGRDDNGDRAHYYKCTKCGHTDYYT
jgi:hypothetical protein